MPNEQSNQDVIWDKLQALKDELGWHEFRDGTDGESQYLLRKMMDLIDLLITERRNSNP